MRRSDSASIDRISIYDRSHFDRYNFNGYGFFDKYDFDRYNGDRHNGASIKDVGPKVGAMFGTAILIVVLVALAGCASTPVPEAQLAVAKTAVDSATTAGGTEFAPLELKTAHDKLDTANRAVASKEYEQAAMLASEAQVDAKLAETKALSAKAQKGVAETQDNLRSMLQEMNRSGTQQQEQLKRAR